MHCLHIRFYNDAQQVTFTNENYAFESTYRLQICIKDETIRNLYEILPKYINHKTFKIVYNCQL